MTEPRDYHAEYLDLSSVENAISVRLADVRRAKAALKARMADEGALERPVTDHAIVRYLERCTGLDVEAIRETVRGMVDESKPAADGDFMLHPSGVVFVIGAEGQVVTVLSPEQVAERPYRKALVEGD